MAQEEMANGVVKLLRKLGHALNAANEVYAAQLAFDCAFAVARSPTDLLSAANMRAKLVQGSAAAEALYVHLLSLDLEVFDGHERSLAHTKLEALRERREAARRDEVEAEGLASNWLASTLLCEESGVPYSFVRSKEELGAAARTKRSTSCLLVEARPKASWADLHAQCAASLKLH